MPISDATRFELRRSLGEGGFGIVFEAWDRDRDRRVALKQLRNADPAALLRFKQEFRALADVSHPNLVRLDELVSRDDEWFFTMELVDGTDLLSWVRPEAGAGFRLPFDERRVRESFGQLTQGIVALHGAGLLHRDLKPSNVLIARDGRVVVLDFGLVTHLAPGDVSRTTQIMGTPAYMSPEQVTGDHLASPSDWYSMGVMLYEALTGRLPFEGAFFAMMASRTQRDPRWPAEVVPGVPADLDALCRDLLHRDPASRPVGEEILRRLRSAPVRVAEPAPPVARSVDSAPRFVGRERELALLRGALDLTRQGRAAVAEISGLSGMGKSTLARRFLAEVREDPGALVLSGRCYQRESVPYKAVDSLVDGLSRYLLRLPPLEAARFLPRDFTALARLFPVLKGVGEATIGRRTTVEIPDAKELRRRGFTALRELLARLADDRTVVLYIDDLQWGDLDSGLLLLEVMQPPDPPPLLLMASYRSDESAGSPLLRLLAERRDATTPLCTIEVAELSPMEARELALTRLSDAGAAALDVAEALARESGGSPFLLEQLSEHGGTFAAAATSAGAAALRLETVIEHRLQALPREVRGLLEIIAVAGRPLDLRMANQAAGLDPNDETAIGSLRAEHWIRTRPGEGRELIETYHDRIRETVVALLPEAVRPACHNRLAAALQASGLADPETLAEHYLNAGDHELASRHALRAADLAADALAFDKAAKLYRQGLELWEPAPEDRARLRQRLADTLANSGHAAEAARAYLQAAETAQPAVALTLTRQAGEQFLISGLISEGLAALRTVFSQVGMRTPATPRQALGLLLLRRLRLRLRGLGFTPRRESEVAPDTLGRMDLCWTGAIGLGLVEIIQAAHFQAMHLELALQAGEPSRVARALIMELGFVSVAGRRAGKRVAELRARCRDLVAEVNQPYPRALLTVIEGNIANLAGRFAESHANCLEAQALLREHCTGVTWEIELAQLYELHSLSHLGRYTELSRRAQLILAEARERRNNLLATYIRTRILFLLHLAADEPERAAEEQDRSLEGWSGRGFQLQHYWNWYSRTTIDLYAGDAAAAWARLEAQWRAYRLSFVAGTEALLVGMLGLRARVAIARAAALGGRQRAAFLTRATRDARRLDRFRVPWASAQAVAARAGIASVRGQAAEAETLLRDGADALDAEDLAAEAAAARWHLGDRCGDRGAAERAGLWMEQEGIRQPARLARMLVPMADR